MSLLIFSHERDRIRIITDTLCTDQKGRPFRYLSKCFIVPHLQMVIAGLGVEGLALKLLCRVQCEPHLHMDGLALRTPGLLREIYKYDASSTIYFFGYSCTKEYVRYRFQSTNGFELEEGEPCFGVKPETQHKEAIAEKISEQQLGEIVPFVEKMREEQAQRPLIEQIHIGGELNIVTLENQTVNCSVLHRFTDYEDLWMKMPHGTDPLLRACSLKPTP